jgi:hypothetical protein
MTLRQRFSAGVIAALIAAVGMVAINNHPASADPPLTNCMPQLTTCGYPTGLTAGLSDPGGLTPDTEAPLYTSAANQVIEDLDLTGCIVVQHANVVIHNVTIHGDCFYGIFVDTGGSVTISDSEVACNGENSGIGFGNFTATNVYVHDCENAVVVDNNVNISDSVLVARETYLGSHGDVVQFFAGSGVIIHHNLLAGIRPTTSAIIADGGGVDDVEITDNFLSGGAYTLYCPTTTVTDWTVTGNRFYPLGEDTNTGLGITSMDLRAPAFGITNQCDTTGITWSGNYTDDEAATVNADGSVS